MEAKCVLPGQECTAQSQGTSFVDPTGKARQGTVVDLVSSTSYDCYVIAHQNFGPGKRQKCSKPVRISTLSSPTIVFKSSVSITARRRLLQTAVVSSSRCLLDSSGNFTSCVDSGIAGSPVIIDGVVGQQNQWMTYSGFFLSPGVSFAYKNMSTCPLNPLGISDTSVCDVSYSAPSGYQIFNTAFDPLARRVWFSLTPESSKRSLPTSGGSFSDMIPKNNLIQKMKEKLQQGVVESSTVTVQVAPEDYYGTCGIDPQGVYSNCVQSTAVQSAALVGPGQDANGFYSTNSSTYLLEWCGNDMVFPCSVVSGIPFNFEVLHLRFLTDTEVYLTGYSNNSNYVTTRCTFENSTTFSNCQTAFDDPYRIVLLLNPANSAANAYTLVVDTYTYDVTYDVCNVAPITGAFENCTAVADALPFLVTSPAFSFPITF